MSLVVVVLGHYPSCSWSLFSAVPRSYAQCCSRLVVIRLPILFPCYTWSCSNPVSVLFRPAPIPIQVLFWCCARSYSDVVPSLYRVLFRSCARFYTETCSNLAPCPVLAMPEPAPPPAPHHGANLRTPAPCPRSLIATACHREPISLSVTI